MGANHRQSDKQTTFMRQQKRHLGETIAWIALALLAAFMIASECSCTTPVDITEPNVLINERAAQDVYYVYKMKEVEVMVYNDHTGYFGELTFPCEAETLSGHLLPRGVAGPGYVCVWNGECRETHWLK